MDKQKGVIITLKSIQSDGNNSNATELITEGLYEKTKDGYMITYDESEATGYKGSTTVLTTIGDKQVIMQRTGSTNSNLFIEKGKKHHCHYGTPYGDFMVGITTKDIQSSLNDNGGDLYMKYVVDINSSYISDHEIIININKVKSKGNSNVQSYQ